MTFQKMTHSKYPPRHWAIVGHPGSGKSTFASQMTCPILTIDADHRFVEVLDLAQGDVYQISDKPADNIDVDAIIRNLNANMAGSDVQTIVVDSLTAIINPLVTQAMLDNNAGRNTNRMSAFVDKAVAIRHLQDGIVRWGCDTLWIYHLSDGRDEKAKMVTRASISKTERARLYRSLNLELQAVIDGERRGLKVTWARRGRSGMTLWDDETFCWGGMPERIEQEVYDGLSDEQQQQIESAPTFPNPEAAIAWGLEAGAFEEIQHARNAYEKVKREQQPKNAVEMGPLWIADVQQRIASPQPKNGNGSKATRPLPPAQLRRFLLKRAEEKIKLQPDAGEPATDNQRGLIAPKLEECFAPDDDSKQKRRAVIQHIWAYPIKDLSKAQAHITLDWLLKGDGPNETGDFPLHPAAAEEARQLYRAALKAEGQADMFDEVTEEEN